MRRTGEKTLFLEMEQRELRCGEWTVLMSVLKVTRDSLSDGGKVSDPDRARRQW